MPSSSDDETTEDESVDENSSTESEDEPLKSTILSSSSDEESSEEASGSDSSEEEPEKEEPEKEEHEKEEPEKKESESEDEITQESASDSSDEEGEKKSVETTTTTKPDTESSDDVTTSSGQESSSDDEAEGIFTNIKNKLHARKERIQTEKAVKKAEKEAAKEAKILKTKPLNWYYTDLPDLTNKYGWSSNPATERAMMAIGICSKTKPTIKPDKHSPVQDTLARLLESGTWEDMGHWDKKGRFKKAMNKRAKAVLSTACLEHKPRDYTGPPKNMTEHVYIERAIHPATKLAFFSGGAILKTVLGQHLYTDISDSLENIKRPFLSGEEGTGLKEDAYFVFVYTIIKT